MGAVVVGKLKIMQFALDERSATLTNLHFSIQEENDTNIPSAPQRAVVLA